MRKFALTTTVSALALLTSSDVLLKTSLMSQPAHAQAAQQSSNLSMAQLQSLVAPIALYPDSLLSQMLMASTYPLEVAEADNWLKNNSKLSKSQLEDALKNQTWDNSVKSLVSFPDALNMMGSKLDWTQKLGDAYLAQPKDVMQAVQALRAKAKQAGNLKSSEQITVSADPQSNIIIQPANPQVIYVPTYNPTVVYGAWPYPAYPPYPVYNPAWGFMSFGVGLAVGAALWSTPHWGSGSITVNNNNFNRFNNNVNNFQNRAPERVGSSSAWNYNSAHRGNVPYSNSTLANRYGGEASRSQIERNQLERQQGRENDWGRSASDQDRMNRDEARSRAQSSFSSHQDSFNRGSSDRGGFDRGGFDRGGFDRGGFDRGGFSHGGFGGGHFGGGFRR